jgi:S-adenosylmethionine decarboxylase
MRDLAPDIFRQRLLVEGFYSGDMDEQRVREFLVGAADHLSLRTYAEPIVFQPDSGMGRIENQGFDAFVPLIDSGISAYIWSARRFFSVLFYTCKGFQEESAVGYVREYFRAEGEVASHTI